MKKRLFISFVCFVLLVCSFLLPCSAALSDFEDTLTLNYVYGSADSSFTDYYRYSEETISQGQTTEEHTTLSNRDIIPNYFFHEFNLYSSTGLPIAEGGKKWNFMIGNFYDKIDHYQYGEKYLEAVGEIWIRFKYSDGYWSANYQDKAAQFNFDENSKKCTLSFTLSPTAKKQITQIQIKYFCDYSDFGLPKFTSSTDLFECFYICGWDNFVVTREEVFPTADSSSFDHYHEVEDALLDDTGEGLLEAGDTFNHLSRYLAPTGSFFKGTLFIGNLLGDLISRVPFLNDLLQISLALGLLMVVIGGVMFSLGAGGGRGKKNASKGSQSSKGGSSGSKGG